MAHYLAYATEAGTTKPREMLAQVRQMLKANIWGVPTTAQLRMRLEPGDGLLVAVGSPYRAFVGDAVVASRYHQFTEEEAAHLPAGLHFEHGITLRRARLWPSALEIMAVWPSTAAHRKNPRALFFGAITALSSADAALIVAAGGSGGRLRAVSPGARAAAGFAERGLGQPGHSVAHAALVSAAPASPTRPPRTPSARPRSHQPSRSITRRERERPRR